MSQLFTFFEFYTPVPSNDRFQLHFHEDYEIYLFLEGDTRYVIEENVYSLEPGDIIIIQKNQMHRAYHNSPEKYHRMVLNVSPDFFTVASCPEYESIFLQDRRQYSKITAETVRSSGLYDAFLRAKKYSQDFKNPYTPVIRSIVTEILYLINHIENYSFSDISNPRLKEIISYLNEHFTEPISLDALAEKFYLSKYHLCHIFSEGTGLTVYKYITNKRLTRADELIRSGFSINDAALAAGFNHYMSYYRARKRNSEIVKLSFMPVEIGKM